MKRINTWLMGWGLPLIALAGVVLVAVVRSF
jgi:hypothetical protein